MNWQDYIISDNEVLLGKPVIKGTRISVDHIVNLLAQGWTDEQIFENYPRINKDSLRAVFAYLYECMQDNMIINIPLKKSA